MFQATGKILITSLLLVGSLDIQAQSQENDDTHKRGSHDRGMHHGGMRGFGDPERMLERMSRHLGLDDIQAQQVSNVFVAAKPEIEVLRDEFVNNRNAMRALDASDPDYDVELQNLSAANADLAAQMTLLHGRVRADIAAILTPEQLEMLRSRDQHRRHN